MGFSDLFRRHTHQDVDTTDPADLLNLFDPTNFPKEHQQLQDMDNNTTTNYSDVCDGTREKLLVLPHGIFEYGKGREDATIHILSLIHI